MVAIVSRSFPEESRFVPVEVPFGPAAPCIFPASPTSATVAPGLADGFGGFHRTAPERFRRRAQPFLRRRDAQRHRQRFRRQAQ